MEFVLEHTSKSTVSCLDSNPAVEGHIFLIHHSFFSDANVGAVPDANQIAIPDETPFVIPDEIEGAIHNASEAAAPVVLTGEEYFESDYESLLQRSILVHRVQLRQDVIKEFSDPNILKFKLDVKVIDERGEEEKGLGNGVVRDVITEFWELFSTSVTVGAIEKVPRIRHDFQKGEWEAVGRLFAYSFVHVGFVPIFLSPAFIATCLFWEDVLSEKVLLGFPLIHLIR